MTRILIADDHPIVRQGLQKILSGNAGFHVAGEATNGREVVEFVRSQGCDVVILDITMPDRNGLDVLEQIRRERPETAVLILSVHREDLYAKRAFELGAAGYMTKESVPEELTKAIRTIASGRKYVSPSVGELLASDVERGRTEKTPHETLSTREFEIMCLIAVGETPKSISRKLFLSTKTVNSYRDRILEKMGMKTNAEITRYAVLNGLIE